MQKGKCKLKKKFYGMITITERGQIAIPAKLRKELGLNKGDKLIVIKRDDNKGVNLVKSDAIDDFLNSLASD